MLHQYVNCSCEGLDELTRSCTQIIFWKCALCQTRRISNSVAPGDFSMRNEPLNVFFFVFQYKFSMKWRYDLLSFDGMSGIQFWAPCLYICFVLSVFCVVISFSYWNFILFLSIHVTAIMKSPIATLAILIYVWQYVCINLRTRQAQHVVFQIE